MSKRPAFRQRDVTRLVRAATAAGVKVVRVEVDASGRISVLSETAALSTVEGADDPLNACPWLKP